MSMQTTSPSGWAVACQRAGCPRPGTAVCLYVDRRGRACATRWCTEHVAAVGGKEYCARHASTVTAVGAEAIATGYLPELDNRVPSLVYRVGRDVDEDITAVLQGLTDAARGESLVVDAVTLVPGGGRLAERRWERSWKVVSHTGYNHTVTVQVVEAAPVDVVVRVEQRVVLRERPPWIAARETGMELDAEQDAQGRRDFYERVRRAVTGALAPS